METLNNIISELDYLIPQVSGFVGQIHDLINLHGINIVTDATGNMSIDVPKDMSDDLANNLSKKVGILDRLISERNETISDIFRKGLDIENGIKKTDPQFNSLLKDKLDSFKTIKDSFKH